MSVKIRWLTVMLAVAAAASGQQSPAPQAGNITAVIPSVKKDGKKAAVSQEVRWNDLITTDRSGRVRIKLLDGSLLSIGTNSQLRVVKHDVKTQQTLLDLAYGRVRSRVTAITRAGGGFQVRTPNAVAGVIGTDFVVTYANGETIVTVYSGTVVVTSTVALVTRSVTIGPGQTAIVSAAGKIIVGTTATMGGIAGGGSGAGGVASGGSTTGVLTGVLIGTTAATAAVTGVTITTIKQTPMSPTR